MKNIIYKFLDPFFGNPRGIRGRIGLSLMTRMNRRDHKLMFDIIYGSTQRFRLQRILDLGFGTGSTLHNLRAFLPKEVELFGLELKDPNKQDVSIPGVITGDYDGQDLVLRKLDLVYNEHLVYFWDEPLRNLHMIKDSLRTGGSCMFLFVDSWRGRLLSGNHYDHLEGGLTEENFTVLLREAGFHEITTAVKRKNHLDGHTLIIKAYKNGK